MISEEGPGIKRRWWQGLIGAFFRRPRQIGTLVPSGEELSQASVNGIERERVQSIVELGAGTGPITEKIIGNMHPESCVLAVEIDEGLSRALRSKFKAEIEAQRLRLIQGDCLQLEGLLGQQAGFERPNVIVSSIPFLNLKEPIRRAFLAAVARVLPSDGVFNQITIDPTALLSGDRRRSLIEETYRPYFEDVQFEGVLRNVPPGGVFHCQRPIVSQEREVKSGL